MKLQMNVETLFLNLLAILRIFEVYFDAFI